MPPPLAAGGAEEERELHELLGNFATYHRAAAAAAAAAASSSSAAVGSVVPSVCVPSSCRRDDLPFDARVFAGRTESRHAVTRWDANELGRVAVVHTWDLTDAAARRLNPHVVAAALREESQRDGIVVSNRGGYHSTPDTLHRLAGEGCQPIGFLRELIEGVTVEAGKPNGGKDEGDGTGGRVGGGGGRVEGSIARNERGEKKRKHDDDDDGVRRGTKPAHATITTSWVNVCREGHSHGLHNHVGAQWSGVYYASVPAPPPQADVGSSGSSLSGHLVLRLCTGGGQSNRSAAAASEEAKDGWCVWDAVSPKEGRLVLFPSWLLHGVMSVRSSPGLESGSRAAPPPSSPSKPRVSIAFNTGERNVVLPNTEQTQKVERETHGAPPPSPPKRDKKKMKTTKKSTKLR